MTKNRARKQATRQRAALTGERYVVAQRAFEETPPRRTNPLHEFMHRVPGMPTHVDGGLQFDVSPGRTTNPRTRHQRRERQHGEPRVLVAWQEWIARRVGAGR